MSDKNSEQLDFIYTTLYDITSCISVEIQNLGDRTFCFTVKPNSFKYTIKLFMNNEYKIETEIKKEHLIEIQHNAETILDWHSDYFYGNNFSDILNAIVSKILTYTEAKYVRERDLIIYFLVDSSIVKKLIQN